MPQIVRCWECGTILYKGRDLKSPEEILQMYDRCPNCGRYLDIFPKNIEIEVDPKYKEKLNQVK